MALVANRQDIRLRNLRRLTCNHDCVYVSIMQILDGAVSLLFDQILHDDESQELGLLLQLTAGHVVHLLPPGVGVQGLVGRGNHAQPLLRVPHQGRAKVGRNWETSKIKNAGEFGT